MLGFILQRIGLSIIVIFGVIVITFILTRIVPSDPVSQWVGPRATQEQREEAKKELGLDKPISVQFGVFLRNLFRGDLGVSLITHQPVSKLMKAFLPPTLELVLVAIIIAMLIGVPLGVISAKHNNRWPDHFARVFSVGAISMPTFWLALMLQLIFFRWLEILPLGGQLSQYYSLIDPVDRITGFIIIDSLITSNFGALWDYIKHLIMPAISLGAGSLALLARMTRSSMLEILNEDYIGATRSYGIRERTVLWKYALKNSLGPTVTVTALTIGWLLVNTFLVEAIFNWPGIGNFIAQSVVNLDYPAIIGVTLFSAIAYVILNSLADIIVALDQRVRQ
jgi:peptide/nickel transport system permease protein